MLIMQSNPEQPRNKQLNKTACGTLQSSPMNREEFIKHHTGTENRTNENCSHIGLDGLMVFTVSALQVLGWTVLFLSTLTSFVIFVKF